MTSAAAGPASALEQIGYSPRWEALFAPCVAEGLAPARVVRSDRGSVLAATEGGIVRAKPSARLSRAAAGPGDLPTVGDWVGLRESPELEFALIEVVMPRVSTITRGEPGKTSEVQVLAANIDTVFVVHPIAEPPNLRRIERELSVAWDSGAVPVVVLTKADISEDADAALAAVEAVALGADVLLTNALAEDGIGPILGYITEHRTAVLVGPSGAGKSTIINALLGEERQATQEVRLRDGRGRHTTVTRELVPMPGGGVLIDTPGIRELGLTGSEDGIASAFPEIEELAASCRFRDCSHGEEPGCAVRAAVDSGELEQDRVASYHKLMREAQVAAARTDVRLRIEEERKAKTIAKDAKRFFGSGGRG